MDEAASLMHARAILEHGYPLLADVRAGWDSFPFHYLMAAGIHFFDNETFGARFFSALCGVISIPLLYALCLNVFLSRPQAWLSASLFTIMTYPIIWSRQARFYSLLILLSIAGLLTLYTYLERRRPRYLLLAAACLIGSIFTHPFGYLLVLLYLLILLFHPGPSGKGLSKNRWIIAGFSFMVMGSACLLLIPYYSASVKSALLAPYHINYAQAYALFLREQMGLLIYLAIIGMGVSITKHGRTTLPLILGMVAYYCVISIGTHLYAFRYCLPILYLLILFAGYALCWPLEKSPFHLKQTKTWGGIGAALLLGVIGCRGFDSTLWPRSEYLLGFTAPQPSWDTAYALIQERHHKMTAMQDHPIPLNTVSALPMFHDIYLGKDLGKKFYIQNSYSGIPGEIQPHAPFSSAQGIYSYQDFISTRGYLILDAYSWRTLADPKIRSYLAEHKPNAIVPGISDIYIWLMGEK